jgi:uncharacterized protein YndB with AHSA1/START domain
MTASINANVSPFECVVRRTLAAPVRAVYRVWTEPEFAKRWSWGAAFTTLSVEIDLRVGGTWRQQVRDKKTGEVWSFDGEFREIVADRRLVHTFHWFNGAGTDHGTSLVAIDFTERGAETDVVITHTQLPSVAERDGTAAGWEDVVSCIAECI